MSMRAIRNKLTGKFVQVSDINGGCDCDGIATGTYCEPPHRPFEGHDCNRSIDALGECAQSIENPDDFELVEIEMEVKVVRVVDDHGDVIDNLKIFMYPDESYSKWGGEITPDIARVRQRRKEAAERGEVLRPSHIHVCGQCDRVFDDGQESTRGGYDLVHCTVCKWPLCPECSGDNHKCEGPDPETVTLEAAMNCPVDEEAIAILMKGFSEITREQAEETLARIRGSDHIDIEE
jgi:hypothetical protein